MELKDTIEMMTSADHKERLKAEYWQTKIRYNKLRKMIIQHESGELDFTLTCPIRLLKQQALMMSDYLVCLETRARIEKIEL